MGSAVASPRDIHEQPIAKGQSNIWWANGIFFTATHIAAAVGVYHYPFHAVHRASLVLCFLTWQAACFGITIGYHRLYSHRAFRATFGVRMVLAILGASGFQGSIKWWCLRHRLHHRFTDDPIHDPYCATKGLIWSHLGWIFFKPKYERMTLIERDDLENDPVVRIQHEYYVSFALFTGFVFPAIMGALWGDGVGSFVWAGLVSRLMTWHCTFLVNSLAHWDGLQPYSDENTSRGNLMLALLTCGEGNHNFHAFPHDFRSGPSPTDWDPSKWIILALNALGLATGLRTARPDDIREALVHMHQKGYHHHRDLHAPAKYETSSDDQSNDEPKVLYDIWTLEEVKTYVQTKKNRCVVVVKGFILDVTEYLGEHPGGATLLRRYSIRAHSRFDCNPSSPSNDESMWNEATWAFDGGLNQHSRAAKRRMRELIIARLKVE
ncbi:fatty acid desaturase-domain-containing protein [Cristinia sonorae]|uniref:Acyl-CoA desaturase n=1 Tax=Cristinia sonorae TaxID=1940300 RepID=A0A8K0USU8_9AGAR|nr:fatty acid desaturase-domain-containing protein [Cristinia sonorae]